MWRLSEILDVLDGTDAFAAAVLGNGVVARVWGDDRQTPSLSLQGAMGMSMAVALGLSMPRISPVLVVEGDGNYLMGSPVSDWSKELNPYCFHVVLVNGVYWTSGEQPLPIRRDFSTVVSSASALLQEISTWETSRGYRLVAVTDYVLDEDVARPRRSLEDQVVCFVN